MTPEPRAKPAASTALGRPRGSVLDCRPLQIEPTGGLVRCGIIALPHEIVSVFIGYGAPLVVK